MDIILSRILSLLDGKHGAVKELADAIGIAGNSVTNWKTVTASPTPSTSHKSRVTTVYLLIGCLECLMKKNIKRAPPMFPLTRQEKALMKLCPA